MAEPPRDVEIALSATLRHESGPRIDDPKHLLLWTCSDGQWYGEGGSGPTYEICPVHKDPEACDCPEDEGDTSVYRIVFTGAGWLGPDPFRAEF